MNKLKRDLTLVTKQLTAYYTTQGLYGKRLRRAVRADRLYVKYRGNSDRGIISQFHWIRTIQGHHYWSARDDS